MLKNYKKKKTKEIDDGRMKNKMKEIMMLNREKDESKKKRKI